MKTSEVPPEGASTPEAARYPMMDQTANPETKLIAELVMATMTESAMIGFFTAL